MLKVGTRNTPAMTMLRAIACEKSRRTRAEVAQKSRTEIAKVAQPSQAAWPGFLIGKAVSGRSGGGDQITA